MKLGISYMVFDGIELLEFAAKAIREVIDFVSVVYQTTSYFGNDIDVDSHSILSDLKSKGLIDDFVHYESNRSLKPKTNEMNIRNFGLQRSIDNGCTHHISADVDEFYLPDQLVYAKKEMEGHDCSIVNFTNYYKEPTYMIVPNQGHQASFIHTVDNKYAIDGGFPYGIEVTRRMSKWDSCRVFSNEEFMVHHMTYIRKDIGTKLKNSSNGINCNFRRIVSEFDTYQLGGKLRVPPDLTIRRTVLVENLFGINI